MTKTYAQKLEDQRQYYINNIEKIKAGREWAKFREDIYKEDHAKKDKKIFKKWYKSMGGSPNGSMNSLLKIDINIFLD